MEWTDVHAHLNILEIPPEEAVKQAQAANVTRMISIGTHPDDLKKVLGYADQFSPYVYASLGIHPEEAAHYSTEIEEFLLQSFEHPRVVAAGEMGLDYYRETSDREVQKKVFRRQLEIALSKDLPVQIHTREAEQDTVEILKEFGGRVRGILHCFTGTQWLCDQALELGLNISISGIVTFKNAQALRDVVLTIPLDRIHVETDSPFLSPVPFRGKKNVPAFVVETAKCVSEMRNISLTEFSKITQDNAKKLFSKMNFM